MKPKASPTDALRAVPPREFVGARNALAAQLAKRGKAAEARQVARLRRPSPVAWALNRASAARPRELGTLLDAVDRLRRAQLGGGDLRAAMERYRAAFEPLVRGANQALKEAGTGVSAALDRRLRSTLLAAVTDRGLRADLEAGAWLTSTPTRASRSSRGVRFRPGSSASGHPRSNPQLLPSPLPRRRRMRPRLAAWPASRPAPRTRPHARIGPWLGGPIEPSGRLRPRSDGWPPYVRRSRPSSGGAAS